MPFEAQAVHVIETDETLAGVSSEFLYFDGMPAALIIAYVPPAIDFSAFCSRLKRAHNDILLIAVSTSGQLCAFPGLPGSLYRPVGEDHREIVLQSFSPRLVEKVSVHPVRVRGDEGLRIEDRCPSAERIRHIADSLAAMRLPFRIDSKDTLALVFVDGLSGCDGDLMEALYRANRFPCLFVGGLVGSYEKLGQANIFDGRRILRNHALLTFIKLSPEYRYAVFKTQNLRNTGKSLVILDADPQQRTVTTVVDPASFETRPVVEAMCRLIDCQPAELTANLTRYAFGIELDNELFVRSIAKVARDQKAVFFYSEVNTGDRLYLLEAVDFVQQTKADFQQFMRGKVQPVGAIFNDCILRRMLNQPQLAGLDGFWNCPIAGFSTLGELIGIGVNQTLTAAFFFCADDNRSFSDPLIENFPLRYAQFLNYFTSYQLSRVELLNTMRSRLIGQLTQQVPDNASLSREIAVTARKDVEIQQQIAQAVSERTLELEAARKSAEHQALTDPLTGIANRRAITRIADREMELANSATHPLSIITFDVDHFKKVNDQYGHAEGDRVLCDLVRTVSQVIRNADLFGRIGGEEFLIVLPDTPLSGAVSIAERIRSRIEAEVSVGEPSTPVTASFGVSSFCATPSTLECLCATADAALYRAKKSGRNRVEIGSYADTASNS